MTFSEAQTCRDYSSDSLLPSQNRPAGAPQMERADAVLSTHDPHVRGREEVSVAPYNLDCVIRTHYKAVEVLVSANQCKMAETATVQRPICQNSCFNAE